MEAGPPIKIEEKVRETSNKEALTYKLGDIMIFEMPSCEGCRTCEMACSFKQKGEFNPSISAIKVLDKKNGVGYSLCLAEKKDGENLFCIACKECVHVCPVGEDLEKVIEEFKKKTGKVREIHKG